MDSKDLFALTSTMDADELIAVCGDWHGNDKYARRVIKKAAEVGVQIIVHVGDFGFWPGIKEFRYTETDEGTFTRKPVYRKSCYAVDKINEYAEEYGIIILWADGNHENFDVLFDIDVDEYGLRWVQNNVCHMPRGSRIKFGEHTWLFVGGAASVDRERRVPHEEWWPQEYITDEDVETAIAGGHADVMVAHDSPWDNPALRARLAEGNSYWPKRDLDLSDANEKRLQRIVDAVKPERYFHGHHHWDYSVVVDDMYIRGLDRDGQPIDRNMVVVGTDGR